jgi:hypothetical protein
MAQQTVERKMRLEMSAELASAAVVELVMTAPLEVVLEQVQLVYTQVDER